jgi:hypothetical protein
MLLLIGISFNSSFFSLFYHPMKSLLFCLLFFSNTLLAQRETDLVKAVKQKLDKVMNYQAKGRMIVDVPFIQAAPSQVTVYYKQPDHFKIIKQDGISILPKGGASINIGSLLTAKSFTAVGAGNAVVRGFPTTVVKLLPLDENSDIVLSTLYIDPKALLVRKAMVTTRENGSYEMDMDFGNYASWGLPDKVVFSFSAKEYKIPKGLTLEYEKGGKKTPPAASGNSKGRIEIQYYNYVINK